MIFGLDFIALEHRSVESTRVVRLRASKEAGPSIWVFKGPGIAVRAAPTETLLLFPMFAYSLFLLFSFQFPSFLRSKLGLFLLFPFALIFTSLITHICFSLLEDHLFGQSQYSSIFGR